MSVSATTASVTSLSPAGAAGVSIPAAEAAANQTSSTTSASAAANSLLDTAQALSDKIFNTDGKASLQDQLKAYHDIYALMTSGAFHDADTSTLAVVNNVFNSQLVQQSVQLQNGVFSKIHSDQSAGAAGGIYQSQLDYFNSLSSDQQQILFTTGINPPLKEGEHYSSIGDWKSQLTALASQWDQTNPTATTASASNLGKLVQTAQDQEAAQLKVIKALYNPAVSVTLSPAAKAKLASSGTSGSSSDASIGLTLLQNAAASQKASIKASPSSTGAKTGTAEATTAYAAGNTVTKTV